jgi:hypothetical protein
VHVYRYSEERTVDDEGVEWRFELERDVVYMMMMCCALLACDLLVVYISCVGVGVPPG